MQPRAWEGPHCCQSYPSVNQRVTGLSAFPLLTLNAPTSNGSIELTVGTWISWFMHVSMHVFEYSCMCTYMFRYMCVRVLMSVFLHVTECAYICCEHRCKDVCGIHVCASVYMSVYTCACKYVHTWAQICWYMCEGVKVCACMCFFKCMHTYTCIYMLVYTYLCMNRCVPECACVSLMYIHMCLYIYMFVVNMPISAQYMYCTYVCIPTYVSIGVHMCEYKCMLGSAYFFNSCL